MLQLTSLVYGIGPSHVGLLEHGIHYLADKSGDSALLRTQPFESHHPRSALIARVAGQSGHSESM